MTRRDGIITASGKMNLSDDISIIIRTTPLEGIDWDFLKRMDPTKVTDQLDLTFTKIMLQAYKATVGSGVSEEFALGAILRSHNDALRYVIDKAVKKRMLDLGTQELQVATVQEKLKELTGEVDKAEQAIKGIEKERAEQAAKQGFEQYISYLMYASDKFAKGKEKTVLNGIVNRIRKEHCK